MIDPENEYVAPVIAPTKKKNSVKSIVINYGTKLLRRIAQITLYVAISAIFLEWIGWLSILAISVIAEIVQVIMNYLGKFMPKMLDYCLKVISRHEIKKGENL